MKLAIIFLNKIEYLEDLLSGFLEIGVDGATVLDSEGMGHIISEHIPIFAGLKDAFAGVSPSNKTIFTVVNEEAVDKIASLMEDIKKDMNEDKLGFMISLPVDKFVGYQFDEDGDASV